MVSRSKFHSEQLLCTQNVQSASNLQPTYLLPAHENILNEQHWALVHWWQVQLAFLGEDLVDVGLGLHLASKLRPAHSHQVLVVIVLARVVVGPCVLLELLLLVLLGMPVRVLLLKLL